MPTAPELTAPFVAVPGFGLHAAYLSSPMRAITGGGSFRIFDLPGHAGGTPTVGNPSLSRNDISNLVAEIANHLLRQNEPTYLLGESLGSTVVVEAANRARQLGRPPAGVVLVSPPIVPRLTTLTRWTLASLFDLRNTLAMGVDVERVYDEMLQNPEMVIQLVDDPAVRMRVPLQYVLWSARMALDLGIRGLRAMREPCLTLFGENDPLISTKLSCSYLDSRPTVTIELVEGASHGILWGNCASQSVAKIRSWVELTRG